MNTRTILIVGAVTLVTAAGQCTPAADVASRNISTAADNFEIPRRITVYNGITDRQMMVMEGFCSLGNHDTEREKSITCKTGPNQFQKNYISLGDNVVILTEQLGSVSASEFHYRVVWRPQSVIPDIDFQGSANELLSNQNTDG